MQRKWKWIVSLVLIAAILLPLALSNGAGAAETTAKRDYTYNVKNILPKNTAAVLLSPLRHLNGRGEERDQTYIKEQIFSDYISIALGGILKSVVEIIPSRNLPTFDTYQPENFYRGTETFADNATASQWKAGYASASVIPQEFRDGKTDGYYLAGFFNNKKATGVTEGDDQRFNAIALDAGAGTVLFCSLDGFGMTNTDIRTIRASLEQFAKEKGIIGINISTTHSHFCLDVHGTGANMGGILGKNISLAPSGKSKTLQSKNQTLMDTIFNVAEATIMQAVNAMEPGRLSYGSASIADLMKDKQTPDVYDKEVHRIRFVPDNTAHKEIWLVNMAVHPTSMSGDTETVSADYPGRIVKVALEKANAQVAFFQGAEAAITRETDGLAEITEKSTDVERITIYATEIINRMMAIADEKAIEPILNFRSREAFLKIDNALMLALLKMQMANNAAIEKGPGDARETYVITELGYCEFGKDLAISFVPCELSAEIAYGGAKTESEAWNKTAWTYAPMNSMTGGRKLLVFGLMNDQFGYVIPDNDHAFAFADMASDLIKKGDIKFGSERNKHYEELLSLGPNTASGLMSEFSQMITGLR